LYKESQEEVPRADAWAHLRHASFAGPTGGGYAMPEDSSGIWGPDGVVVTGSQQQELMGIPASGQTIRVEGMNFYRLKDGRVTDIWTQFDGVALMQQLGAIPA
jgi:SnoaL-like polyketide cyclase